MGAENITATLPYDIQHAPAGCDMILPGLCNAKVRATYFYWSDNLDAASTIKIANVPPGASILGLLIRYEALGDETHAVVAQLGDAGDAARYIAASGLTTMAVAGYQFIAAKTGDITAAAGVITKGTAGMGYRTPAETAIIITLGAVAMTQTGRMDGWLIYTVS